MTTGQEMVPLKGSTVYDHNGEKIGKVREVYYSHRDGSAAWIGLGTGPFAAKHPVVPVEGLVPTKDGLAIPYTKAKVKAAPEPMRGERHVISPATERQLFEYYAMRPAGAGAGSQQADVEQGDGVAGSGVAEQSRLEDRAPERGLVERQLPEKPQAATAPAEPREAAPFAGRSPDLDEVIRFEEEFRVAKRKVELGHVRLRMSVETELVSREVELGREHVVVEREPIDELVDIQELPSQTVEMTLYGEEPVVEKYLVAKERVFLRKQVEHRTQEIRERVRRERVEVEFDEEPAGGSADED